MDDKASINPTSMRLYRYSVAIFSTQGPVVERFEGALAERVGARHAIAVSSGTAGLHIACLAAGVGSGDRGLTAAITFAASANCLLYAGAEAGFVDIDYDALGVMPALLDKALMSASDVKAIVPVHFAGLAHASAEIRTLAKGRIVIEDAAHSVGPARMPAVSPLVAAHMRT